MSQVALFHTTWGEVSVTAVTSSFLQKRKCIPKPFYIA